MDPLGDEKEKKGFLSKLKFWGDDENADLKNTEFLISLVDEGMTTDVIVLDKEGQREGSETAGRILAVLHEQLK